MFTVQRRYANKPIVEFEIAAQEQMKITELRLGKLFTSKKNISSTTDTNSIAVAQSQRAEGTSIYFIVFYVWLFYKHISKFGFDSN